ncbi:MAG: undecaprenyldiphospho-muramoylpentapeptide beta-N-acetylglucosaminyltransferase [Gammaproteobacteria bacterium]|nr:MAG: undecaprenyldiphospho-muramoylpentapeptide beta-N-acetylglucosaminyltransferase [Gammaproteobacteria bacterium]
MTVSASRTVLIMAGGTGGHVFPALAIADALRAKGNEVVWLGTQKGIEARLVPQAGIPLFFVSVSGIRGKGMMALLKAPLQLLKAVHESVSLLRRIKPACVLGMGGFAAGPGGLAAWLLRYPLVIHEQNAVAGTTNRLLSRLARRVLVAFPDALRAGEWVGNPVRASIAGLPMPQERSVGQHQPLRILVLGGSLGARALNQALPKALAGRAVEVFHQTGKADGESVLAAYQQAGVPARVETFVEDMAAAYAWADLAICRAGALTVAELAAAGVGSVLVPYPHAIDDHQTRNAAWLADSGAAVLMPQPALEAGELPAVLDRLLAHPQQLAAMAAAARAKAKPESAQQAAMICEECMHV